MEYPYYLCIHIVFLLIIISIDLLLSFIYGSPLIATLGPYRVSLKYRMLLLCICHYYILHYALLSKININQSIILYTPPLQRSITGPSPIPLPNSLTSPSHVSF